MYSNVTSGSNFVVGPSGNNEEGVVRTLGQGADVCAAAAVHGEGANGRTRRNIQQSRQRHPRDQAPHECHQQSRHHLLRLRKQGNLFTLLFRSFLFLSKI